MATVSIEFPTEEAGRRFLEFMDGHGEQTYWEWADGQDDKENYVRLFVYNFDELFAKGTGSCSR